MSGAILIGVLVLVATLAGAAGAVWLLPPGDTVASPSSTSDGTSSTSEPATTAPTTLSLTVVNPEGDLLLDTGISPVSTDLALPMDVC